MFPTAFTPMQIRHKKTPLVCVSGVAVGLTIGNDFVGGVWVVLLVWRLPYGVKGVQGLMLDSGG